MIRWRFILPRLVIMLVIMAVLHLASGPMAGWMARLAYENSTGARLDIEDSTASFFPPRLEFRGVQCADPRHERENLAEFDFVQLRFDGQQLLHRRWVIDEAKIVGMRFSSERETDGRIPKEAKSDAPSRFSPAVSSLTRWLGQMAGDTVRGAANNLETVQLSRQLEDQWKASYEESLARAKRIEGSVKSVRDSFQGIDNPLRDLPRLQEAVQETQRLQQDLQAARKTLSEAPNQFQNDLQKLNEARQRDAKRMISYLPVDGDVESLGELSDELIRNLYTEPMQTLRDYMALGTKAADLTVRGPKPPRNRGMDHDLDGRAADPFLLVRRCELGGNVTIDRDEYALIGLAEDFALAEHPTPLRLRLRLDGPCAIKIDYQRDPNEIWPHHLTLHVPKLQPKQSQFDVADKLTIRSAPVPIEFWADIATDGKQLAGRLIAKQQGTSMTASLAGDSPLIQTIQSSVNQSLAQIQSLEVEAKVEGAWTDPQFKFTSNLAPALKNAFAVASSQAKQIALQQLQGAVDQAYQQQAAVLDAVVKKQQAELDKLLARAESEVQEVTSNLTAQLNKSPLQIGRMPGLMNRL